jgi:hypothetical protein
MIRFAANPLLSRLFRLDGPLVPFIDKTPDTATPPVVSVPPTGPAAAPAAGPASPGHYKPGRGRHADTCIYLDIPEHCCVDSTGYPTSQTCHATEMALRLRASIAHCVCGHPVADHRDRAGWCRSCGCSYPEVA